MRRVWVAALVIAGCGGGSSAVDHDAAVHDAAVDDAATHDAEVPDAEVPDAAAPDAYQGFLIDGTLLDAHFLPIADRLVVTTSGASDTTDAQGRFVITGVTPPYDLAVLEPGVIDVDSEMPAATVYLGLTRPDPTIVALRAFPVSTQGSSAIAVSGLGGPLQGRDLFALFDADATDGDIGAMAISSDLYTQIRWAGSTQLTGRVHLFLQSRGGTGATTAISNHGTTASYTLIAGGNVNQTMDIGGAPATGTIAGTASFPAGAAMTHVTQYVQVGGGFAFQQGVTSAGGAFSLIVPDLPTSTSVVCARARGTGSDVSVHCAAGLDAGATGVTLDAPSIPTTTSPAPDATAPVIGPYTWTSPGGVSIVEVITLYEERPSFLVVTTGTSTQVPDLSALGVTPPPTGAPYVWRVIAYPGIDTVDAAASGGDAFLAGAEAIGLVGVHRRFAADTRVAASAGSVLTQP